MTLEQWNTLATCGTFIVIAATAIAAIVQLRHARSGNQIAALRELHETVASPQFVAAQHFVLSDLAAVVADPAFRYQVTHRSARTNEHKPAIAHILLIGNFYEQVGILMRARFIDRNIVMQTWSGNIIAAWQALVPITTVMRRFSADAWEHFEYLTVLAQDWEAAHPRGVYPAGLRRFALPDPWVDEDARYEASLPAP